jgi:two-component system, NtrC family, sensor kinase
MRALTRGPGRFAVPRRLASQLIFAVALIVLITKGVSSWITVKNQEAKLLESMTLGADQLSRSITSATWHAMLADHREDAYKVMTTIAQKQGIERIRMFNKDGVLMFSTVRSEKLHVDESAEVCAPCHSHTTPLVDVDLRTRSRVFRASDGRRNLAMITPIYNEPSCRDAACHAHPANLSVLGVLDLTMDATRVDAQMDAFRTRTLATTVIELALVGGFLVFFTRKFVQKPIRKLIGGTKAVARMELDQPIDIRSSEELEDLADSFNTMRERLKAEMQKNAELMGDLENKVEERTAQLRAAEHKLIQTDRMASLGQLAASVAHEINNPVSGVLNLSMLMQRILKDDGVPSNRIADFRRYLGQVAHETARVGRIVSDLLSFSRRSKPQSSDADLNAIIRRTVSLVNHKLSLAGIELDLQLDPQLPHVHCDASQIQQVVLNLVMNGAEAIKGPGRVTVKTRPDLPARAVILEVADNGPGIPPELVDRIFEPFFTTKEEGKGVGLGLAVVYGIVEAHGGDIDVESRMGEGSLFRVVLPIHQIGAGVQHASDQKSVA